MTFSLYLRSNSEMSPSGSSEITLSGCTCTGTDMAVPQAVNDPFRSIRLLDVMTIQMKERCANHCFHDLYEMCDNQNLILPRKPVAALLWKLEWV